MLDRSGTWTRMIRNIALVLATFLPRTARINRTTLFSLWSPSVLDLYHCRFLRAVGIVVVRDISGECSALALGTPFRFSRDRLSCTYTRGACHPSRVCMEPLPMNGSMSRFLKRNTLIMRKDERLCHWFPTRKKQTLSGEPSPRLSHTCSALSGFFRIHSNTPHSSSCWS